MAEYQHVKVYTSNIVDIVIAALATVANITIVAYYLDQLTIKSHVIKPTRTQSIAIIEVFHQWSLWVKCWRHSLSWTWIWIIITTIIIIIIIIIIVTITINISIWFFFH